MSADRTAAPASDYDQFVNWQRRLEREAPLFRRVFGEADARTVLDVGAGSARHSIMFATWGMGVTAIDPSPSMLAQAEENLDAAQQEIEKAGGSVSLVDGGFGELAARGLGPADALICTGNALPHVADHAGLREALSDFAAVVRPDGALVLHLLNHDRLLESRVRSIPPVVRDTPEGAKVFLRVIDYPEGDEHLDFDFLTLVRDASGAWTLDDRRSLHTALPSALLLQELQSAGFDRIELLGSHSGTQFDPVADESVIVVARRAAR